jgi:hypothetical protein
MAAIVKPEKSRINLECQRWNETNRMENMQTQGSYFEHSSDK